MPNAKRFNVWAKDSTDGEEYAVGSEYKVYTDTAFYPIWKNVYTMDVSASPTAGGTVTGGAAYEEGASVTVTAAAKEGYHFVRWTENDTEVSTEASYTFTAAANRSLVAVFEEDKKEEIPSATTYTIGVSASPTAGGTVTGGAAYDEGASVTVTATAKEGYHFVRWTENDTEVSTEASYTFTATANRNLVAVFEEDKKEEIPSATTYTIGVSASPTAGGTVTGGAAYDEGASVTVTAAAKEGYHFVRWTENDAEVSAEASYTFTATANRNLVAVFEEDKKEEPVEPGNSSTDVSENTDTNSNTLMSPKTGEPETSEGWIVLVAATILSVGICAYILWRRKKVA